MGAGGGRGSGEGVGSQVVPHTALEPVHSDRQESTGGGDGPEERERDAATGKGKKEFLKIYAILRPY